MFGDSNDERLSILPREQLVFMGRGFTNKSILTYRKVPIPIKTTSQLILASLSRPLPAVRPLLPISPELLRFHHCQGDKANKTLTKLRRPREARPLMKCSVQVASSSSIKSTLVFNLESDPENKVEYGSR